MMLPVVVINRSEAGPSELWSTDPDTDVFLTSIHYMKNFERGL